MIAIGILAAVFVLAFSVAWFSTDFLAPLSLEFEGEFPAGLIFSLLYWSLGMTGVIVALISGVAFLGCVVAKIFGLPVL